MKKYQIIRFIWDLYKRYIDDEVPAYAAEMAYYFILSLFPFLIFLITIIGYLPISSESILQPLERVLPEEAYRVISINISMIMQNRNMKLISFGFVSTFWAASSGVGAAIRGINKALCEKERRPTWKAILLSLVFTMLIGIVIVAYFALIIFGDRLGQHLIGAGFPIGIRKTWNRLRYGVSISMMIFVFTALYRYSPCHTLKWLSAVPGAVFSTLGWLLTSFVFDFYVNHFLNLSLIYGSIGGIIVLLIWLFISSQLIILGGELNALLLTYKKDSYRRSKPGRHKRTKATLAAVKDDNRSLGQKHIKAAYKAWKARRINSRFYRKH